MSISVGPTHLWSVCPLFFTLKATQSLQSLGIYGVPLRALTSQALGGRVGHGVPNFSVASLLGHRVHLH